MTANAIPGQVKKLARKLMYTNPQDYVVGPEGRAALKKFGARHPVLRTDYPDDTVNNVLFDPITKKEKTTRRGDYDDTESEKAYEEVQSNVSRIVEKAARNFNAQKAGAVRKNHSEFEHTDVEDEGGPTAEKQQTKFHVTLPPQVASEDVIAEDGEPGAGAPATSDSPGWGGDSQGSGEKGSPQNEKDKDETDNNEDSDNNSPIKEVVEAIALTAAELYENIGDDVKPESWMLEKLTLAKDFVESVNDKLVKSSKKDKDDGEPEGDVEQKNDAQQTEKPTAFKESTDENDDGWYSHKEMYGKVSREAWKKGWRYNHSKEKPFYDTKTKTWHSSVHEETISESFKGLAAKAAKEYGSKEAGEKVAGAILARIRKG